MGLQTLQDCSVTFKAAVIALKVTFIHFQSTFSDCSMYSRELLYTSPDNAKNALLIIRFEALPKSEIFSTLHNVSLY